jgi:hypothetical protein
MLSLFRTTGFAVIAVAALSGCATRTTGLGDVTDVTDPARAGRPIEGACTASEVRYCQANGSRGEAGICTCMSAGAAHDVLEGFDTSL